MLSQDGVSHAVCSNPDSIFSLRLCWVFPYWNCCSLADPGGGRRQTAKQGLHKPDLTYFVKRLKCKLTENVFSPHHLLAGLGPRPIRRLPVLSHHCEVRNGRQLKFPFLEKHSRGSTTFVLGFNEWHPASVRCSRPPHGGCPHYYPPPNPAPPKPWYKRSTFSQLNANVSKRCTYKWIIQKASCQTDLYQGALAVWRELVPSLPVDCLFFALLDLPCSPLH